MTEEESAKFIKSLLTLMVSRQGSDLYLVPGAPPSIKCDGEMTPLSSATLTAEHTLMIARSIMSDTHQSMYERNRGVNFAISPMESKGHAAIGRFRCNVYRQRGSTGMVLRLIPQEVPSIKSLNLPPVLSDIVLAKRGLVILVGATGSGKSTTLAAMIDHRNEHSKGHIVTVEDPIEIIHPHKNCIVSQREVGTDTIEWEDALKDTLRQAPDVILMGEIRDRETMDYAVAFAETGHLVLATLHANSANQALDRIINFFPEERKQQLLLDLSLNLRSIIAQRLIPKLSGKGRVAAMEILINTPVISDNIEKGEVSTIKEHMKHGENAGMQTFDQSLFALYESGQISYENALRNADSVNDLRLQIKLKGTRIPETTRAEEFSLL